MAQGNGEKHIVIIGGGIIGCSTAYFLTRHPSYSRELHKITLLEASGIAGGASGKAGGLLALWAYPSNLVPLSYRLHAELAKEHGGEARWGYRRVHCGQLDAKGRLPKSDTNNGANGNAVEATKQNGVSLQKRSKSAMQQLKAAGFPVDLDWVAPYCALGYEEMGDPNTTAQVHPYLFTTSMAKLAEEAGVEILTDSRVTSINQSPTAVESVSYTKASASVTAEDHTIPASSVILAAGPWTQRLLPRAPISGLRAHSVTITPSRPVSAYALFTSITLPPGFGPSKNMRSSHAAPEIYARPDEIYACGEGDRLVPLPSTTRDVEVDQARCDEIIAQVGSVSDELRDGKVTARQACYLPECNGRGGPFIGEVKGVKGLVLAAGHTCWGIQNGPGTGKVVSEIVMDGRAQSCELGALDAGNL